MGILAIGIDVSKDKLDVVKFDGNKQLHKVFDNSKSGCKKLIEWIGKDAESVHASMEATGAWWETPAEILFNAGWTVSVLNPCIIKNFGRSRLKRSKTDKVDAALIAEFCFRMNPPAWKPLPPEVIELQELSRRLSSIIRMRTQELNRLKSGNSSQAVGKSCYRMIDCLDEEIKLMKAAIKQHIDTHSELKSQKNLLISIPGIGEDTAAILLAEIGSISLFQSARQLAAYAGLAPREIKSGSSVFRRARLSKIGNSRIRKALYFPALTAVKYNSNLASFQERLISSGKAPMAAIGAVMRKLVHLAFAVLKHQQPFRHGFLSSEIA